MGPECRGRLSFQSTLPMKGVTQGNFLCRARGDHRVSIHTPNEGSDWRDGIKGQICAGFQSTLPMKGVTRGLASSVISKEFQSTLPMKGVT